MAAAESLMGNLVKVTPVCFDTFKHAWKDFKLVFN